jgi:hypothetical protein
MQHSYLPFVKSTICCGLFLLFINISIMELNPSLIQSAIIGFSASRTISITVYPVISFYVDTYYYGSYNAK